MRRTPLLPISVLNLQLETDCLTALIEARIQTMSPDWATLRDKTIKTTIPRVKADGSMCSIILVLDNFSPEDMLVGDKRTQIKDQMTTTLLLAGSTESYGEDIQSAAERFIGRRIQAADDLTTLEDVRALLESADGLVETACNFLSGNKSENMQVVHSLIRFTCKVTRELQTYNDKGATEKQRIEADSEAMAFGQLFSVLGAEPPGGFTEGHICF